MKQSYSTSEVAAYCHVTADTIRKWAEAGRIRVFKTPGGHRRIRREDLIRFLRENNIPIHSDLKEAGVKILIVDAERTVASGIRRFLDRAHMSFLVEEAHDSFDAGHAMATFQPDVAFLDLQLGGVDTVDLCRRLKESTDHAGTQLIVTTSPDGVEMASRAMSAGASAMLRKPFTPDDLRRTLAQVGVEVS
jgi:excisionase family DNA binding protein